jgi:hypothetical protein
MAAITGTILAVGQAGMSFAEAAKQSKLQDQANADAEKAMAAARSKLEENFYEGLDINLKSFEQERDALAGVTQNFIQAGQEGERGVGAVAGRAMLGLQEAQKGITNREISSLEGLEQLVAGEESRLRDENVKLDLGEVQGAQIAASDAAKAQAAAITGAAEGLGAAGTSMLENSELYNKDQETRKADRQDKLVKNGGEGTDVGNLLRKAKDSKLFSAVGKGAKGLFSSIGNLFGIGGGGGSMGGVGGG